MQKLSAVLGRAAKRAAVAVAATLMVAVLPAGAASASTTSTYCDGWKIASANTISGGYGAVQLLRNYCHADGEDYTMWAGRGFIYGQHSAYWNLEVFLHDAYGGVKRCELKGNSGDMSYCTTGPMYMDITAVNSHYAEAYMWACNISCWGGIRKAGYGKTATI